MSNRQFRRVTKRQPCEICRHPDWCTFTETVAFCMRVSWGSFKTSRNGAFMHRSQLEFDRNINQEPGARIKATRASDDHLNLIYSSLLETLPLSAAHTQSLIDRGLSDAVIQSDFYRSAPTGERASKVVEQIKYLNLAGVPGFYKRDGKWAMTKIPSGILIPVRNATRQICGLQLRLDDPTWGTRYIWFSSSHHHLGASSGAPNHWSKPELLRNSDVVLLTEGALKANIISYFLEVPVIAAAGVRSFGGNLVKSLKANYPRTIVVICFDSDWRSKDQVRNALKGLRRQLSEVGLQWLVRCWPPEYKGYDDYLLAYHHSEVVR